jgi:c(7)-type cytochrome triheme protein
MNSHRGAAGAVALMLAVVLTAPAAAQSLPRLPADIILPQSGDSPGKVTFSHANHISYQAKPDCTVCHPKLAPILSAQKGVKLAAITHSAMLKGQMCGACHGKTAHGFDDCTTCHK